MTTLSGKIAKNTASQIGGKAGTAGLGVLATLILTRYLGPEGYGTFTFVIVFVTLFATLADWGTSLITIREASKEPTKAGKIIGNMILVRFGLALIGVLVVLGLIWWLPNYSREVRLLTSVASLSLLGLSLKASFQIIFNVKLRMQNWAVSELLGSVFIIASIVLGVLMREGLLFIILAYLIGDFISAVVAFLLARRMMKLDFKLNYSESKALLWEALPMGAILVVFTIYNRVDTLILLSVKGSEAVGYYGLAYKIYEVVVLGAAYFANSVLPIISNLAVSDKKNLGMVYRKSFVILAFLGVGAALTNLLLAPITPWVFGMKFLGAVMPLQILSLALVVSYFNHLNGYTLIAIGKQWYSFGIAVVALSVNLILNLVLIPKFSYNAAAFNTFLTEGLIVVLSLVVIRTEVGVWPRVKDLIDVPVEFVREKGRIF